MGKWILGLFLGVVLAAGPAGASERVPTADFFKKAEVTDITLSPTGEYITVSIPQDDRTILAAFRAADMSLLGKWDYGAKKHIQTVRWVGPDRFFMYVAEKSGSLDRPRLLPDLYATNVDGTRRIDIPNGATYGFVNALWDDPSNVLVQRSVETTNLFKLNVYTGAFRPVMSAPLDLGWFLTDEDGEVHYAAGEQDDLEDLILKREGDAWSIVHRSNAKGTERMPWGVSSDGAKVLFGLSTAGEPKRVVMQDSATGKETLLSSNPKVDPNDVLWSSDGTTVLAVHYSDGYPGYEFVDKTHPESLVYAGLINSFPDHAVSFDGISRDGNVILLRTYSDTDPGSYYLFDRKAGRAKFLLAAREWIDPSKMSHMVPITFKARDGTDLQGFLTIPRGSEGKNLPLVLHPHGGPFGVRDWWGFDPTVQFLANRGYAVLQVNFRGSSGYGTRFVTDGYEKWGTLLIDDMTDAVEWVVRQGIADKSRICTFGGSYGGYAALQSVVREQGRYRCAIGYIGVYDIPKLFSDGDVSETDRGQNTLTLFMPESDAERRAQSPAYNAEKLNVPLMIAHGARDERAPISQYRSLIERLRAVGKAPEVDILEEKEGHGFYDQQNNIELHDAIAAFLDKYIGPGRAGAAANQDSP